MGNLNLNMVGKEFTSNAGYTATIIKYVDWSLITIKFNSPYKHTKIVNLSNLRDGKFINIMAPSIFGTGIMGGISNKNVWYGAWRGMLDRCYGNNKKRYLAYINCTVAKEWHYFPNFIKWAEKQNYKNGWALDKD